ncbi:MAG: hypothetical protein E5X17_03800 [Mesorhizobium sp.]|nr:MAG: hypothetical protein E5X17_03800 [Mesorhizobium sp.]
MAAADLVEADFAADGLADEDLAGVGVDISAAGAGAEALSVPALAEEVGASRSLRSRSARLRPHASSSPLRR